MTTAENKEVVRRFYEEFINKADMAEGDAVMAETFFDHKPLPKRNAGRDDYKQYVAMMKAAFPDFHVTIEFMVAEGDKVVARLTLRGTHKGNFMGIPPTGRKIVFTANHILRVVDGKLAERWGERDRLGLLEQLGAIPQGGPR